MATPFIGWKCLQIEPQHGQEAVRRRYRVRCCRRLPDMEIRAGPLSGHPGIPQAARTTGSMASFTIGKTLPGVCHVPGKPERDRVIVGGLMQGKTVRAGSIVGCIPIRHWLALQYEIAP